MSVPTPRVTLRPWHPADAERVAPWLAEAYTAVDGARSPTGGPLSLAAFTDAVGLRWPGAECLAIAIDDEPVGFLVWRRERAAGDDEATVIRALAVSRDRRNVGYGAEAVESLEELHPARTYLAASPRANGLVVYFWLRTGYRPVRDDEDPALARDPDHLWMIRASDLHPTPL